MSNKPFLAARIPEELNQALSNHSETTGESKTQTLINALSQYLGVTYAAPDEVQASAHSLSLASRIARLEEIIEKIQGTEIVINTDNNLGCNDQIDNNVINLDNASSPKAEEERSQPALFMMAPDNSDNNIDNKKKEEALSTKELAEKAGINSDTVKGRARKGTSIEHHGIIYNPVSKGTRGYWWVPQQNKE